MHAFPAGASWLADRLHDRDLIAPVQVVAPISLLHAYAVNLGTLNATRRFGWAGRDRRGDDGMRPMRP